MSVSAHIIFIEWVLMKAITDKQINWLLTSIRRESSDTNPIKKEEKIIIKNKPAKFSLSDSSDVLSKLKASMEAENK